MPDRVPLTLEDLEAILIGEYDVRTRTYGDGIVQIVKRIADRQRRAEMIDSIAIKAILAVIVLNFLGLHNIADIATLLKGLGL